MASNSSDQISQTSSWLDAVADGRHRAEQEEGRVVVAPGGGKLDERAMGRLVAIRQVRVEGIAVIDEPVLLEEIHGVPARIGRGSPRPERLGPQDLLEDLEALDEQLFLLLAVL